MNVSKSVEQAARRFFEALELEQWHYTDHASKPLIVAAFHLYALSWSGPGSRYDVGRWEWPLATLQAKKPFVGDEPWTVLLRRAVELAVQTEN